MCCQIQAEPDEINISLESKNTYQRQVNLIKEAFSLIGHEITFKVLPNVRSMKASNHGDSLGEAFRMVDVKNRYTNLIKVPFELVWIHPFIYKYRNADIHSIADLKGKTFASVRGYLSNDYFVEKYDVTLYELDTVESAFKFLNSGRADLSFSFNENSKYYKPDVHKDIVRIPGKTESIPLYLWIHKSRQELIPELVAALKSLTATE